MITLTKMQLWLALVGAFVGGAHVVVAILCVANERWATFAGSLLGAVAMSLLVVSQLRPRQPAR